jgi:hypothetical protein
MQSSQLPIREALAHHGADTLGAHHALVSCGTVSDLLVDRFVGNGAGFTRMIFRRAVKRDFGRLTTLFDVPSLCRNAALGTC